jgi:hypothetical protein
MPTSTTSIFELQPGLLNIKPVPLQNDSVDEPDNSEIRKIVEDVVNAVKYSLTATVANPGSVRSASIESEFAAVLEKLGASRPNMANAARSEATALVQADESVRLAVFGRHGAIPAQAFAGNGFERSLEDASSIKVDAKLLGVTTNSVTIPTTVLRPTDGGLLIPGDAIIGRGGNVVAPEDFQSVVSDADASAAGSGVFDQQRMESVWGATTDFDPYAEQTPDSDFMPQAAASRLGVYVRRVKCEDETDPEWWGNDEIALGGISTDENGDVKKIGETFVGSGFKDGKSKSYSNWQFHWFTLNEEQFWPKKYGITFVLAEKDNGGLSEFLNNLWAKVREKVKDAIVKALEAAGAAVGGYLGSAEIGKVIGRVLGQAVAWAINKLVEWLIGLFKDDIFKPGTAWLTLPSAHARWHYPNGTWGNPWSGIRWFRFSGFGGRYLLEYQWRLY